MNEIINQPEESYNEEEISKPVDARVESLIREFEMFSMQKSSRGLDLSQMNSNQVDQVIGMIGQSDRNSHELNMKRLEVFQKLNSKKLDSDSIGEKTERATILSIIFVFAILTALILFFKDNYLGVWLSFIAGLMSGVGISTYRFKNKTQAQPKQSFEEVIEEN